MEQGFLKYFSDTLQSENIRIEVSDEDTIRQSLESIAKFQKSWLSQDISEYISDYIEYREVDDELSKTLFWFKSNGYDFEKNCHDVDYAIILLYMKLMTVEQVLKSWSLYEICDQDQNDWVIHDVVKWMVQNKPDEIISIISNPKYKDVGFKPLIEVILDVLLLEVDNSQLLSQILNMSVNGKSILGTIGKSHMTKLLKSSDPELRMLAAQNLIPQELKDLFDISLTPKVSTKAPIKAETKKKSK